MTSKMKKTLISALCFLLYASVAHTHPAGGKKFSHRLRVQILQDRLEIGYLAEIPNRHLNREFNTSGLGLEEFLESQHASLSRGILSQFNHEDLALHADEFTSSGIQQGTRSTAFELHFSAPTPGPKGQLLITNTNLQAEHAFFFTQVSVENPIEVLTSSLVEVRENGELDYNGRWSMLESHRELRLDLASWERGSPRGELRTGEELFSTPSSRLSLLWLGLVPLIALIVRSKRRTSV